MLSQIPIITQILGFFKSIIDLFPGRKPQPPPPVQIINVNQVSVDDRQIKTPSVITCEASTNSQPKVPVVILPPDQPSESQPQLKFMSDDYLVDLTVELRKKLRPGDRIIFKDPKGQKE